MNNKIQNSIEKQKEDEKNAVKRFLANQGVKFDDSLLKLPSSNDDYTDIIYNNIKYQVTEAPAGMPEVIGKLDRKTEAISEKNNEIRGRWESIGGLNTKWMDWEYDFDKLGKDYIVAPIFLKKERYGKIPLSEKITLLIYTFADPPLELIKFWIDGIKQPHNIDYYNSLKELNFEFIYLVLTKENIQIFP